MVTKPPSEPSGAEIRFDHPLHVGQLNLPRWDEFRAAFEGIFDRQFYANHGPLEQQLDQELAAFFGVRHAISMVNATAALMLLLRALEVSGEVIVPSHTFPATVQSVVWAGLTPVFCDVDAETQNLTAALVAERIGPATAAILGVHVWGRPCDPNGLAALADAHGLRLVFDAAHAIGCTFEVRRLGGRGDAEVFSFHATKILNGVEGGCVTTDDDELAARLRTMRSFHADGANAPGALRLNAKLSEAQAAMALIGLRHFDRLAEENRERYELYRARLAGIPGLTFIDYAAGETSNFQFIALAVSPADLGLTRDELMAALRDRNVLARSYFHPGVHRTSPFRETNPADLPVTDHLSQTLIQLPTGQAITSRDVEDICRLIREVVADRGDGAR